MWDKLGLIIWLVIGCSLIIFRKRVPALFIRKQFEERPTPKKTEYLRQLKEMKFEGVFQKVFEIVALAFGVFIVLGIIPELIFPQADKYIRYFIAYSMLSFFAACAAGLVELKFIAPFLTRDIRKHTQERYGNGYQSIQNGSGSDKLDTTKSEPTDDPVLRTLRRKAFIYLVVSFVVLFAIFVSAFYTIFIITS